MAKSAVIEKNTFIENGSQDEKENLAAFMNKMAKQVEQSSLENMAKEIWAQKEALEESPIYLPSYQKSKHSLPNIYLRSALFQVSKRGSRKKYENRIVATLGDLKIIHGGEQLDQLDLETYEACIHFSMDYPLGKTIFFNGNVMLKYLGRNTGGRSHKALQNQLMRLVKSFIAIKYLGNTFYGHILEDAGYNNENKQYFVTISPKITALFSHGWTEIDPKIRSSLGESQLSKWLYGFICSHISIYPMFVETYHELTGSDNQNLHSFRQKLQIALQVLEDKGLIKWRLDDTDKIHITKSVLTSKKSLSIEDLSD